jgi:hypothetical protein
VGLSKPKTKIKHSTDSTNIDYITVRSPCESRAVDEVSLKFGPFDTKDTSENIGNLGIGFQNPSIIS